jgi:DHA2 family methylenomycin A resistance protein-like MFS transporter
MSAGAVARPELIEVDAPAAQVRAREITASPASRPGITLAVAVLGFFVITFDAVVVNVALPSISRDFSAGITGLQWVVDGYTLMFAALLLWSGALADRVGARRAFGVGLGVFVAASAACGLAPTLTALIAARFAQGSAAAMMMPASMALLGQAFPDPRKRSRAVAAWAMGGAIASSSGPVLGGLLTLVSWRLIFLINIPVGVAALLLVTRIAPSARRRAPFDWFGQVSAVVAMGALTYGAIEAGASGFTAPSVVGSLVLAAVSAVAFVTAERLVHHPMVPLALFRSGNVSASVAVGFAFVFGYFGLPFVMSLYLQQVRGLSALGAGLVFVPMMVSGAVLVPFSARLAERLTPRIVISAGLGVMGAGLAIVGCAPASTPVWALAALMVVVGVAGPLVIPPMTAVLLNSVPGHQAGTASGVFNTSRQLGGALAIAIFGALLSVQESLMHGLRLSLLLAAGIAIAAGAVSLLLRPASSTTQKGQSNVRRD